MLGCLALMDILFGAAAVIAFRHGPDKELLTPALGLVMNLVIVAFISRRLLLQGDELSRRWIFGATTIRLPEVELIKVGIQHGKSRFEETKVVAPSGKISFTSAETNYVAVRNAVIARSANAAVQDERPPELRAPFENA